MATLIRASGIVLTGGASRRMGRDKAFVTTGDPPMTLVERAAAALRSGGCPDITCVGGDLERLDALGLRAVADDHPGEGPLGGVLTGLRHAALDAVVVLACDLPAIDGVAVRGLVRALTSHPGAAAAVAVAGGHLQVHAAAYRRSACDPLVAAFEEGERSIVRALAPLPIVEVDHIDPDLLVDVDGPDDLDR